MEKNQVNKMLLLKSGFWYTVSNYLTRAMVFITMPLFTRLMTKEQYGDFSVFANLQAILLVICGLESYSTINRARFDFESKSEFDEYITSSLLLSSLFTMSLFMLYLLFPNFFSNYSCWIRNIFISCSRICFFVQLLLCFRRNSV